MHLGNLVALLFVLDQPRPSCDLRKVVIQPVVTLIKRELRRRSGPLAGVVRPLGSMGSC